MEINQIYCGDCLELLSKMGDIIFVYATNCEVHKNKIKSEEI